MKKIIFETDYFGQVLSKKNGKIPGVSKNGKPFVRRKREAIEQENEMAENFRYDMKYQNLKPEDFIGKRIEVIVEVWNKDNRRHDTDGQVSTIFDALVKGGVLPDDNQKIIQKHSCEYKGVDKEDPRAQITVIAQ